MRLRRLVPVMVLLATGAFSPARLRAQVPVPVPGRVQIDGPGSFGPRAGERLAVIVDGRRIGGAVCDYARRLVPDGGPAREWLRAADSAKIASVRMVIGPGAARKYDMRGAEVGALVITTRRPPNDSSPDGRAPTRRRDPRAGLTATA